MSSLFRSRCRPSGCAPQGRRSGAGALVPLVSLVLARGSIVGYGGLAREYYPKIRSGSGYGR